jgi:hypothetical protein
VLQVCRAVAGAECATARGCGRLVPCLLVLRARRFQSELLPAAPTAALATPV